MRREGIVQAAAQPGFYVSFSGESSQPIDNLYAISAAGAVLSTQVLGQSGQGSPASFAGPFDDSPEQLLYLADLAR
jgi:hypothetical protein